MIAGWLLIFPAGVFIARFGRTAFVWLPKHRAVQIGGMVVVLAGLVLGEFAHTPCERHHVC
jgi:hypothetical protein